MSESVSIVIPLHNEESNIEELMRGITQAMGQLDNDYEVLLINDGSTDDTWTLISQLASVDSRIKGISLGSKYGQTLALRAGFRNATGEIIVAMDGDQQHDPAYLPLFIQTIEEGYDLASGTKAIRPEKRFRRFLANFAHFLISKLSGIKMEYFGATFKAYRRYLLQGINLLGDAHRFLGALVAKNGVKVKEIPIEIKDRKGGKSNYSVRKVFQVILDLLFLKFIVSYMHKPFRLFGAVGGAAFVFGFVFTMILSVGGLFFGLHIKEDFLAEFLFFIACMLVGLFVLCVGILAEIGIYNYYSKTSNEPYIVKESTKNISSNEEKADNQRG